MKKPMFLALVLILLYAIAPVLSALAAGGLANALGCRLDEGSVHACMFAGRDIGETLYTMGVAGWLFLFTIPSAVLLLVIWVIVAVILGRRRVS